MVGVGFYARDEPPGACMPALNLQLPPTGELEAPTNPVIAADIHHQTQSKHALPVST
jgi:hypothetical protein